MMPDDLFQRLFDEKPKREVSEYGRDTNQKLQSDALVKFRGSSRRGKSWILEDDMASSSGKSGGGKYIKKVNND